MLATDEQFEPRIEGSVMYARGACDMKAEVVMMMELKREFSAIPPNDRPLIVHMLSTDEEVGGLHGINYLVNTIGFRARVALIPDGGDLPQLANNTHPNQLLERIRGVVDKGVEVDLLSCGEYAQSSVGDPYIRAYSDPVSDIFGRDMEECITHGVNDGRFLSALGVPTFTSRPRSNGQHLLEEWIDLNSLSDFKNIYRAAIRRFTQVSQNFRLS